MMFSFLADAWVGQQTRLFHDHDMTGMTRISYIANAVVAHQELQIDYRFKKKMRK
ncbi:hypothetical protein [Candidatus Nitronereus thalassa]|uniref:Uncharacterized protein n=1 Tax=Candidatus Nitronereus thalassa TaxID=3020898 RepID=A0ABU3K4A3_9BACT|nr:hypothetical protein [Candidatus Nitronereus thalassa]MDT7041199.1 hypothetical protein [Candidatus Nitronereus thalassa]